MTTYKTHKKPFLILASKSPRRKELLEQAGIEFSVIPSDVNEDEITVTEPDHYVRYLAEAKARDISGKYPETWVLGADTIVLIDGLILGKPGSKMEACDMLKRLSGRTHVVYTGYCLSLGTEKKLISRTVRTRVHFKELSDVEINWYIHTPEPYDKAGAYAIQGLGSFLVRSIEGSYTNVVGLPVCEVFEALVSEGVLDLTAPETCGV